MVIYHKYLVITGCILLYTGTLTDHQKIGSILGAILSESLQCKFLGESLAVPLTLNANSLVVQASAV